MHAYFTKKVERPGSEQADPRSWVAARKRLRDDVQICRREGGYMWVWDERKCGVERKETCEHEDVDGLKKCSLAHESLGKGIFSSSLEDIV